MLVLGFWCVAHEVHGKCHSTAVLCRVHPQDEVSSSISVRQPGLGIVREMTRLINPPGLEALVTWDLVNVR